MKQESFSNMEYRSRKKKTKREEFLGMLKRSKTPKCTRRKRETSGISA